MGRTLRSSHTGGGGRLAHQAGQRGQVQPDVSLEGECAASGITIDRQLLDVPAFKGGVAPLRGIAGAVIEAFPGRGTGRDVPYQVEGAIPLEALADVDELAAGQVQMWVLVRRVGGV